MNPLNRAERNNAFLGFLLFFIITIALVVTVVLFSVEVPFRQNEQLRKMLAVKHTEKELSDSFYVAMKDAIYVLNQYDDAEKEPKDLPNAINRRVQFRIEKMDRMVKNLPAGDSSIYALAIDNLMALNEAKAAIRRLAYENK